MIQKISDFLFANFKSGFFSLVFLGMLVSFSFLAGMLWMKVEYLKKGSGVLSGSDVNIPSNASPPNVQNVKTDVAEPSQNDHKTGNLNADIVLIEYSDYSCPYCKNFHTTMQQVMENYGDRIMWVLRHYPLTSIHPLAYKQAAAAECISKIGGDKKFWEFTDKVFLSNTQVNEEELAKIAGQLGINQDQYQTCLAEDAISEKVDADYSSGLNAGVTGTPTSFIMDLRTGEVSPIKGAMPYEQVKASIESMLK